jgi:hypothetical protein
MRGRGRRRRGRLRSLCEEAVTKRGRFEAYSEEKEHWNRRLEEFATHKAGWETSFLRVNHVL